MAERNCTELQESHGIKNYNLPNNIVYTYN